MLSLDQKHSTLLPAKRGLTVEYESAFPEPLSPQDLRTLNNLTLSLQHHLLFPSKKARIIVPSRLPEPNVCAVVAVTANDSCSESHDSISNGSGSSSSE